MLWCLIRNRATRHTYKKSCINYSKLPHLIFTLCFCLHLQSFLHFFFVKTLSFIVWGIRSLSVSMACFVCKESFGLTIKKPNNNTKKTCLFQVLQINLILRPELYWHWVLHSTYWCVFCLPFMVGSGQVYWWGWSWRIYLTSKVSCLAL